MSVPCITHDCRARFTWDRCPGAYYDEMSHQFCKQKIEETEYGEQTLFYCPICFVHLDTMLDNEHLDWNDVDWEKHKHKGGCK